MDAGLKRDLLGWVLSADGREELRSRVGGALEAASSSATADDTRTATELIEAGVGLIAQGMFRLGDRAGENNPQAAYDDGMAAVSTIRSMAFDFLKRAKIDELANKLYDKLNPKPNDRINVSKAECIRRAEKQLSK